MDDRRSILIGGGSGLIGTRLTEMLTQKGYQVRHLGRRAQERRDSAVRPGSLGVKTFEWDIHKQTIDKRAFEDVNVVINLAGANVNDRRWTKAYKHEILNSRTGSTKLIVDFLNNQQHQVTGFLSGSAIGYYGFADNSRWHSESDPPGNDFMAQVVVDWEQVAQLRDTNIKVAHIRTGIVLSSHGGALPEMARPIKLYAGAPLGSGKQNVSWIHPDDICAIFIHIIENNLSGTFNAVAPEPATNEEITKAIAKRLHKPLWLPNIPEFVLRAVLGEMTDVVVNGLKVSSKKIQSRGFKFQYPKLEDALNNIEP